MIIYLSRQLLGGSSGAPGPYELPTSHILQTIRINCKFSGRTNVVRNSKGPGTALHQAGFAITAYRYAGTAEAIRALLREHEDTRKLFTFCPAFAGLVSSLWHHSPFLRKSWIALMRDFPYLTLACRTVGVTHRLTLENWKLETRSPVSASAQHPAIQSSVRTFLPHLFRWE